MEGGVEKEKGGRDPDKTQQTFQQTQKRRTVPLTEKLKKRGKRPMRKGQCCSNIQMSREW